VGFNNFLFWGSQVFLEVLGFLLFYVFVKRPNFKGFTCFDLVNSYELLFAPHSYVIY